MCYQNGAIVVWPFPSAQLQRESASRTVEPTFAGAVSVAITMSVSLGTPALPSSRYKFNRPAKFSYPSCEVWHLCCRHGGIDTFLLLWPNYLLRIHPTQSGGFLQRSLEEVLYCLPSGQWAYKRSKRSELIITNIHDLIHSVRIRNRVEGPPLPSEVMANGQSATSVMQHDEGSQRQPILYEAEDCISAAPPPFKGGEAEEVRCIVTWCRRSNWALSKKHNREFRH